MEGEISIQVLKIETPQESLTGNHFSILLTYLRESNLVERYLS